MSLPLQLFALAIIAMLAGPALYRAARTASWLVSSLDAFVMVAILGLLGFHVLPEAFSVLGVGALVLVVAGWVLPMVIDRSKRISHQGLHKLTLSAAVAGLAVHTMLDGVALAGAEAGHEGALQLALAVVLHRLPVGMFLWHVPRERFGRNAAIGVLGLAALTTALGFALGDSVLHTLSDGWFAGFQALVAGSLLHVVIGHKHEHEPADLRVRRIGEAVAVVLAVGLLVGLSQLEHGHGEFHEAAHLHDFGARLLSLSYESAPALLLGYLLAGLLGTAMPARSMRWLSRGSSFSQAARGVAFGAPLPICSCGVVPVYHGMVSKGVPMAAGMAFLVATPELGIEAILLSVPLLGPELTITRVICAVSVALLVGWILGRKEPKREPEPVVDEPSEGRTSPIQVVRRSLRTGLGTVVDETSGWILAGLVVAAAIEPGWLAGLSTVPGWAQVALFAVVGMPVYVCASGATPLAAALIFGGVSPGAAIAFLIAGPATNITTFGVLRNLHGRNTAIVFGATVVGLATTFGVLTNLILPSVGITAGELHEHGPSLVQTVALVLLSLVFAASLYRRGPRSWLATVVQPDDSHDDHDHDHDHDHGHDAGDGHCGGGHCCD